MNLNTLHQLHTKHISKIFYLEITFLQKSRILNCFQGHSLICSTHTPELHMQLNIQIPKCIQYGTSDETPASKYKIGERFKFDMLLEGSTHFCRFAHFPIIFHVARGSTASVSS